MSLLVEVFPSLAYFYQAIKQACVGRRNPRYHEKNLIGKAQQQKRKEREKDQQESLLFVVLNYCTRVQVEGYK